MFKKSLITLAVTSCIMPLTFAQADDDVIHQGLDDKTEVIVVIGKVPRKIQDVVGSVTVINSDTIDKQLVHNVSDLMRYEMGINVMNSGSRFGNSSIAIRGISGNRIATEIDGVPVAEQFNVGSYSNSGRNNIDPELIKQVEILRGPASSIYGSDAIGGVVSFITKKPSDLLSETEKDIYVGLKTGYHSVDNSKSLSLSTAFGNDVHSALISASLRKGHETDSNSNSDLATDLQDNETKSLLAKYFYSISDNQELSFSYDYFKRDAQSDIRSIVGLGRFRSTTKLLGDDETRRSSFVMNYDFVLDQAWLEGGVVRFYDQSTDTQQLTDEARTSRGKNYLYDRDFYYQQDVTGARANLYTNIESDALIHHIGYGVEWSKTTTKERRDGLQTNTGTGSATSTILSEQFPLRDFPTSDVTEWGVYLNDEIEIANSDFTLIPALRYDSYELSPKPDAMYLVNNAETKVVAINENSVSPKLGLLYQLSDTSKVYFQYVKGFRAPPFEDANIGLDIPLFKIRAIPNPDLKSETTDGYELGFNYKAGAHQLDVVGFYNDYKDFIQTKVNLGFDPVAGRVIFQSQNIDSAKIYGAEVSYKVTFDTLFSVEGNYSAYANMFWSKGENKETNDAINEIEPNHALLGMQWLSPNDKLSLALHAKLVAAKTNIDELDDPTQILARTAGFATFDFIANYHINSELTLSAAVNNITDRSYARWSDVNGMLADDRLLATLAAPGINGSVQLKYRW